MMKKRETSGYSSTHSAVIILLVVFGICLLGALPYYFSNFIPDFSGAFFESVSGFTATGATVIRNIEALPSWLLFWRSITQWLGSIGFLVIFMLFPLFTTGNLQYAKLMISNDSKITPGFFRIITLIILIYFSLTAFLFFLLVIFGMNWFDALTHSFSVMSTGGFFIKTGGISGYNSPTSTKNFLVIVEWISALFMFIAGMNIIMILSLFQKRPGKFFRNSEIKAYSLIIAASSITIFLLIFKRNMPVLASLRQAIFHTISFLSTTGFYTSDLTGWPSLIEWPSSAQGILFLLLFIGGCSFSAAGGVKVIRYVILYKQTLNEMKRLVYPRGIFNILLNKNNKFIINNLSVRSTASSGNNSVKRIVQSVTGFVFLYFLIVFSSAFIISLSGPDVFHSLLVALVCQSNTGLGSLLPFHEYPVYVKTYLSFLMIAGRLEIWIFLIIINGDYWRFPKLKIKH